MPHMEGPNWSAVGELLVCFFPAGPVEELRWSQLCAAIASEPVRTVLLSSIGALELDGAKREELSIALCSGQGTRIALVSDEALVRGTMTAMSWRRRVDLKLFIWHKLADAHAYLAPSQLDLRGLNEAIEALRKRLEAGRDAQ